MMSSDLRRIYQITRVDFLERMRSRKLVAFLAGVAYVGYLVNVGFLEMTYTLTGGASGTHIVGEPTAALIGVKTGVTGGIVVIGGAFYLMRTAVQRDRRHGHGPLVASSETRDAVYLVGKLVSNVALGVVVVATLGVAAVINHAVHGVGPTDPLALITPLVVLTLPVCVLVGGVALLFETIRPLDGTLGTVVHIVLANVALGAMAIVGNVLPGDVPLVARVVDLVGYLPVYELTIEAIHAEVPGYDNGPPAIGTLRGDETFTYRGGSWPLWVVPQRVGVVLTGVAVTLAATIPFDRFRAPDGVFAELRARLPTPSGLVARLHERLGSGSTTSPAPDEARPVEAIETTPVGSRDAGGFGRLVVAEFRLAARDHQWWWYLGALAAVVVPVAVVVAGATDIPAAARGLFLTAAFVWPVPIWSRMGSRAYRYGVTDLLFSSRYPLRQVVAEWLAGVVIGGVVGVGTAILAVASGSSLLLTGAVAGAVFPPSLAIALGVWTHSSRLFEVLFLLLWYIGPINGFAQLNFLGTRPTTPLVVPLGFVGGGVVLVGVALLRRFRETA